MPASVSPWARVGVFHRAVETSANSLVREAFRKTAGLVLALAVGLGIPAGFALAVANGMSACDAHRWNCGATAGRAGAALFGGPIALILIAGAVALLTDRAWPLVLGAIVALGGLWGYLVVVFATA